LLNLGRQHPKIFGKKGSKILKLPSVCNCFTLAMTKKLVVIINSLKVPKMKKILLYEMKFLVQNYSCLQNPWLGGYRPQIPVLSSTKFVEPPLNKIPGYATAADNLNNPSWKCGQPYLLRVPQNEGNQVTKNKYWSLKFRMVNLVITHNNIIYI